MPGKPLGGGPFSIAESGCRPDSPQSKWRPGYREAAGCVVTADRRAKISFWLDGGYDYDLVQACPHHPQHKWWTFRMGDVVKNCRDPDERMTICAACYVPRCGSTADADRCTLWRHHATAHLMESGKKAPMGFTLTGAS